MSQEKPRFSVLARLKSIKDALAGIALLLKNEHNSRVHLLATVLVILLAFYLSVSTLEWALLTIAITMVWSAEAFNTALEYLCNKVSPEHDQLIGQAKDVAAAAVLLTAIGAVVLGALVFIPYLI